MAQTFDRIDAEHNRLLDEIDADLMAGRCSEWDYITRFWAAHAATHRAYCEAKGGF